MVAEVDGAGLKAKAVRDQTKESGISRKEEAGANGQVETQQRGTELTAQTLKERFQSSWFPTTTQA